MHIAYYDETGDDGYPSYSSKLFVLTSCYIEHQKWKDNYLKLSNLKDDLKRQYGFPKKQKYISENYS